MRADGLVDCEVLQVSIIQRIISALSRRNVRYDISSDVLDHVPVNGADDWRKQRLSEAAQKHGKPFKCAAPDMPREVLVGGKQVALAVQHEPVAEQPTNVTHLPARRKIREPA